MAKLILTLDGVVLKEFALTKERTTIGRKAHNDVQIDNLAVSGEHAAIVTILNDSFLEDLGSTNGTLVNGQPIKKHFLQNGDLVEIGKYKVKYVNEQGAGTSAADFEKTMVLRAPQRPVEPKVGDTQTGVKTDFRSTQVDTQFNNTGQQAVSRPIPPQAPTSAPMATNPAPAAGPMATLTTAPGVAPAATMQGVIQILSGPNAGRELPLVKALTTLGKPGVQVAVITKRPQGYFITHVEGATVPVVNGQPLNAQAHILNDHDIVELAGVKMEFFYKPTA